MFLEPRWETSHGWKPLRVACLLPLGQAPQVFLLLSGAPQIQRVMTMMIRDHDVLFPKSKDAPLSPPAQKNDPKKPPVPRSSVGWDASEDAPISRADSFSNAVRCREPSFFHLTSFSPCHSIYERLWGGKLGSLG